METENLHRGTRAEISAVFYWTIIALLAFVLFKVLAATFYGVLTSIFTKEKTAQF
jgi:hypothetical protein